jgi:hypothetical protein
MKYTVTPMTTRNPAMSHGDGGALHGHVSAATALTWIIHEIRGQKA